jgi:serine/threonine-protein kinase
MYAGLLAVLLVALGVVLFLLGRSLGAFGGGSASSTKVAIPGDLIGKSFSEASAELSAAHLTAKEVDSPNAAAAGQVFRVVPEPGSRVASGSTVELDVSTGPSTSGALIIPNVVGTTYPQPGGQTLQAAGFVVVLQTTPSSSPYGTILSQDPPGGASGHQGDKVTVVVSTGPAAVTVPDVAGKTLADAAYALGQAGFRYTTQKEPSDSVPAGNVTRTDPPGGTQAPRGSTVTVFVSNGPATVSVPDVVGMTQAEATSTLEAKGFNAQVVSVTVFDPTEDGRVQSQSPQGGTLAPQGSTVTINVGRFGSG